jgi:hypothetical protein
MRKEKGEQKVPLQLGSAYMHLAKDEEFVAEINQPRRNLHVTIKALKQNIRAEVTGTGNHAEIQRDKIHVSFAQLVRDGTAAGNAPRFRSTSFLHPQDLEACVGAELSRLPKGAYILAHIYNHQLLFHDLSH